MAEHDVEFDFIDNRVKVNATFNTAIEAFLLEVGAELVSQIARRTPVDTGQLKGSWAADVDPVKHEVAIGSPLENSIWTEFGTGEYALHGDGRKTAWWYKDKKGKWRRTKGKRPKRMLYTAFNSSKEKIKRAAQERIGAAFND